MQQNTGSSHGDLASCSLNLWDAGAAAAAAATSSYSYTAAALDDDDGGDDDDDDDDDGDDSRVRSSNPSSVPAASCIDDAEDDDDDDEDIDRSNDQSAPCNISVDSLTHHISSDASAAAMINADHHATTTFGANTIHHHHHHHHHHHQMQKRKNAALVAMAAPDYKKKVQIIKSKKKLKPKDQSNMMNVCSNTSKNGAACSAKIKRAPQRGLGVAQLEKLRRLMDPASSSTSSSSSVTNPNPNPALQIPPHLNPNPNPAPQIPAPRYIEYQSTRSIPPILYNDIATINPSAAPNQHSPNYSDDPQYQLQPILAANRHHNPSSNITAAAAITTAMSSSAGCGISPSLFCKYNPIPNPNPSDHQHHHHHPPALNSNSYDSSSCSAAPMLSSSGNSNRMIHNAFDFTVSAPDHQIQIAVDKKKQILQAISHIDYISELACRDHCLRQANNYDLLISDLGSIYKQQCNDEIDSSGSHCADSAARLARSTAQGRDHISDNSNVIHKDDLKLSLCINRSVLGSPNRSIMNNRVRDQAAHINNCNLYAKPGLDLSLKL